MPVPIMFAITMQVAVSREMRWGLLTMDGHFAPKLFGKGRVAGPWILPANRMNCCFRCRAQPGHEVFCFDE
jgi:hypothetical protein